MDLLGSILGSMTKPPTATEREREERKKAKEMAKKMEEKQKEHTKKFRQSMEEKVNQFLKTDGKRCLVLEPMNKIDRSLVHDVAEVAGIIAHSFGEEGVDRYTALWKKEDGPCEDELAWLRSGKEWDPDENEREKQEKLKQDILDDQERRESRKNLKKIYPKDELSGQISAPDWRRRDQAEPGEGVFWFSFHGGEKRQEDGGAGTG